MDLRDGTYMLMEDYILGYITVPKGFIFDGASIPKMAQYIIGSNIDPRFLVAALVHDWLYNKECKLPLSRDEADALFMYILIEEGTDETLAYTMHWAVSTFGAKHYKSKSYKVQS